MKSFGFTASGYERSLNTGSFKLNRNVPVDLDHKYYLTLTKELMKII
jgi:hypothetical protein